MVLAKITNFQISKLKKRKHTSRNITIQEMWHTSLAGRRDGVVFSVSIGGIS